MRFFIVYALALTIIGLNGLDTAERVVASRTVAMMQASQ
jgi:hypothetical protein